MNAIIIAIAISALGGLLRSEVEAWAPFLAQRLLGLAVRRAPKDLRARLAEEWAAHLEDVPGHLGKLIVSFGFLRASYRIPGAADLSSLARAQKRLLDLLIAVPALISLVPILVVVGFAIRLWSPGPVLFRQTRMGAGGLLFAVYKFRSAPMFDATGAKCGGLKREQPYRLGQFLRATSIDELPQLLNVIRGDMTIVGPRPQLPSSNLPTLKPGLTGLGVEQTPEAYASQWSLARDLLTIARTFRVLFRKDT